MNIKHILLTGAAAAMLGISTLACAAVPPAGTPAMRWEPEPMPLAVDAAQAGENIAAYTAFGYLILYQYPDLEFTQQDACDIASYMGFARLQLETAMSDEWAVETWFAALRELGCLPDGAQMLFSGNAG